MMEQQNKKPQAPLYVPTGSTLFRLLCHSSRIGGIIGKNGSVIKNLQTQTSAKIRVEDGNTEDRIISIIGSSKKTAYSQTTQQQLSAAQEAVLRVFERIVEVAVGGQNDEESSVGGVVVSCRMVIEGSSVGAVIGKGGKIIERIKSESGCKIRVLGHDKVPTSAWPDDEIVEIEGDIVAVKNALVAVSCCIQDITPVDKQRRVDYQPYDTIAKDPIPNGRGNFRPQQSSQAFGGRPSMDPRIQQRDVVFRMLCSVDIVGGVIGKGGSIIRSLQQESGALVVIEPLVHESVEQLIIISAMETSGLPDSPAQNAAVLVHNRLIEAASEKGLNSGSSTVSARLLVSPNQVGCLLGKGGTIISDMRRATRTSIRIIGDDQVPKCASENDQVVQITGEVINVRHALYVVTGKLRDNLFSSKMSNGVGTRSNSSMISTHEKSRIPPSTGLRASAGASQVIRHTNLADGMDNLRLNNNYDRSSSPRLLASQHTGAGVNSRSIGDGRQLASVKGGVELGSGSRTAIVMNTTVEIIVPENVIGSVYGENGSNLTRLREISGAKAVVHEPRPGTTDRIVVISGTPDETQAAQSLLQAFILTGRP